MEEITQGCHKDVRFDAMRELVIYELHRKVVFELFEGLLDLGVANQQ